MTLILNNDEIAAALSMGDCIDALEDAFLEQAQGRAINQIRYDVNVPLEQRPERNARYEFKTMVGILPKIGVAALRMSSTLNHRPIVAGVERSERLFAAGQNRTVGLVQLYSVHSGEPLAIMPDGIIQAMRVGGTYGLAMKYLARTDSSILGLLGSGWQARFQVAAAAYVFKLSLVKVYSPNSEHRERFANEMSELHHFKACAVSSAEEAVRDVDILISATNARSPTITEDMVQPGMHIAAIKSQEWSDATLAKGNLIVAVSANEYLTYYAGEGQYGRQLPASESTFMNGRELPLLESIIVGKIAGRTRAEQITMLRNGSGIGIQFAAVAAKAYERAKELGYGREIPTDWFTQTVNT
jgi:ornithine cyclodeaminase/alanine dehydrogenase-like protein (mu-crystallin family)